MAPRAKHKLFGCNSHPQAPIAQINNMNLGVSSTYAYSRNHSN